MNNYLDRIQLRHWLKEHHIERQNGLCDCCGEPLGHRMFFNGKRNPLGPSLEHKIPLAEGGVDSIRNTCVVHIKCNYELNQETLAVRQGPLPWRTMRKLTMLECPLCFRRFESAIGLADHIKKMHGEWRIPGPLRYVNKPDGVSQ